MIIVIQKEKEQESVEILIDEKGLEFLRRIFNKEWHEPKLGKAGLYDLDHEHLSSNDWGGDELSPEFTSDGADKIHSLKIVYLGKQAEKILS